MCIPTDALKINTSVGVCVPTDALKINTSVTLLFALRQGFSGIR
jgi:hypothetical protein